MPGEDAQIDRPVLALAPLAGLSHGALRSLVSRYGGCDLYFSEMTSADALDGGGEYERFYLMSDPHPDAFILQLVSGKAEHIVSAISKLSHLPILGFDINMGCGAPHIMRKGGGYAWMSKPDLAARLVSKAKKGSKTKRLSAKIRIGDTPDEKFFVGFIKRLADAGLDAISIHPKTGKQSFNRPGYPEFIGLAVSELSIPVFGNGDVRSYASYERMAEVQHPAGIMIGREAVKSPWIFHAITEISAHGHVDGSVDLSECVDLFESFLQRYQPADFQLSRCKLFLSYFVKNFTFSHELGKRVNRCDSPGAMVGEIQSYIERNPHERYTPLSG